jgi:hypothetical protein
MVLDETLVVWDVELHTEALERLLYALMTHRMDHVQGTRAQVGGVGDENALAVEEKTIGQAPGRPQLAGLEALCEAAGLGVL